MLVGGLVSADPVLERPGQIHSDDLIGCIHSISVNGRTLNMSNPLDSHNVDAMCKRDRSPCAGRDQTNEVVEVSNPCGDGHCLDRWKSHQCVCSGLLSADCGEALEPYSFSDGSFVEFKISEKYVRMQLLYHGSTLWSHQKFKRYSGSGLNSGKVNDFIMGPPKSLSVIFRTVKKEGLIVYSATNKDFTSVEVSTIQLVLTLSTASQTFMNKFVFFSFERVTLFTCPNLGQPVLLLT